MSRYRLVSLDNPSAPPFALGDRLRSQLVYFLTPPDTPGVPPLAEGDYWFDPAQVDRWLEEGVIELVSPLDTANLTEVEISEEQENLLQWLKDHATRHARVEER